ncbi:MAG: ABC transporter substrate-binding protein [Thermoanaerobaculia bacterium]
MTRRDFLASLAALAFAPEARVIRVGHAASDERAVRGAQLGAEEAGRTAELLGARFELRNDFEGVVAIVGGAELGDRGIPLLTIRAPEDLSDPGPFRPHVFHVSSTPAERREALARWGGEGGQIVDWHPSLTRFGAEQLNSRFESRFGAPMDSLAWASWLAVMIAAEMALRATPLERLRFDGHKGERLSFRPEDHGLRQPLYVVTGCKVVGEVSSERT